MWARHDAVWIFLSISWIPRSTTLFTSHRNIKWTNLKARRASYLFIPYSRQLLRRLCSVLVIPWVFSITVKKKKKKNRAEGSSTEVIWSSSHTDNLLQRVERNSVRISTRTHEVCWFPLGIQFYSEHKFYAFTTAAITVLSLSSTGRLIYGIIFQ